MDQVTVFLRRDGLRASAGFGFGIAGGLHWLYSWWSPVIFQCSAATPVRTLLLGRPPSPLASPVLVFGGKTNFRPGAR